MSATDANPRYHIVNFIKEKTRSGQAIVDLVPISWVRCINYENVDGGDITGMCSYPPYPNLKLKSMVENVVRPGLTWKEYPVKILGSSVTHERGQQKVRRALQKLTVPTDDEGTDKARRMCNPKLGFNLVPPFPMQEKDSQKLVPCFDIPRNVPAARRQLQLQEDRILRIENEIFTMEGSPEECATVSDSELSTTDSPKKNKRRSKAVLSDSELDLDTPKKKLCRPPRQFYNKIDSVQRADTERNKPPDGKSAESRVPTRVRETASVSGGAATSSGIGSTMLNAQNFQVLLDGVEQRLTTAMEKVKRSNNHDFRKLRGQIHRLQAQLDSFMSNKPEGDSCRSANVIDFENKWVLPYKELTDFERFDETLKDASEFAKVLESLWIHPGCNQKITRSVLAIMERYLSKNVALNFSALGRGKLKKNNFSTTNFYKAFEQMVMTVESSTTLKDIRSAVSKVLSCAGDWEGGRLERGSKKKNSSGKDMPGETETPQNEPAVGSPARGSISSEELDD